MSSISTILGLSALGLALPLSVHASGRADALLKQSSSKNAL